MRTFLVCAALAALTGCGAGASSYVHSDAALGRVVVYRNGIAYFERTARIEGDTLSLAVPADKVDDFLKSLTVVDARTGEPAPIAYPTQAPSSESGLIDMKIALQGAAPHDLRLTYVTEAPAWKPSYRVVLDKSGKVNLQAWAIVDNTSGEDWKNVQLGVGSSSALSFRFDLRSIRSVLRDTLRSDDMFAQAPPMGGAAFANDSRLAGQASPRVVAEFSDDLLAGELVRDEERQKAPLVAPAVRESTVDLASNRRSYESAGGAAAGPAASKPGKKAEYKPDAAGKAQAQASQIDVMARNLKNTRNQVIIEGYADRNDGDKHAASLQRANRAREQLIRMGIEADRIVAVGNGEQAGRAAGVRVVEAPAAPPQLATTPAGQAQQAQQASSEPIGTSHFESTSRMTVGRGTSAMVSILKTDTDGEVVYFFDPESARGNTNFPFRAVRIKNPTDSVLESGPVTVFGEGKFIGEGLAEPIPARSVAFVPFALDRQIVVEKKEAEDDKIARILTVQRGVFSTQVQHIRKTTLVLTNRTNEAATVYIRHTVPEGYTLINAPTNRERIGSAHLFRASVGANGKAEVVIEEATPLFKTTDLRSPAGMDLVVAYLSSAAEAQLKASVDKLLALNKEMADTEQKIATIREQMAEYRTRMDELHAQLVTLKAVKTAGPLMQSLEKKLTEVSDRLSKSTIDLVGLQEKLMVARVRFQDGVSELSLEKKAEESKGELKKPDDKNDFGLKNDIRDPY